MFVMIGYIFMFKMVEKKCNFRFRNGSWVNTSLNASVSAGHCQGTRTSQNDPRT